MVEIHGREVPEKGVPVSKKKGNRAEEAKRGTKADPERQATATDELAATAVHSWYVNPLDEYNLSKKESLTKKIFTTVEVILCLVIVIYVISATMNAGSFSADSLQDFFAEDPTYALDLLLACLQGFAMAIVRSCYTHYAEGDGAYARYNLLLLLCAEIIMESGVGVAGCAVLLWRIWKPSAESYAKWSSDRTFGGKVSDLLPTIVFLLFALLCFYMNSQLS